jgi:hypothetical protein
VSRFALHFGSTANRTIGKRIVSPDGLGMPIVILLAISVTTCRKNVITVQPSPPTALPALLSPENGSGAGPS